MSYTPTENELGIQPIAVSSTTQNHPLGKIVRAADPALGAGEFIYLLGVANTVVGSLVNYAPSTYQTALQTNSPTKQNQPVAVAMAANGASGYGWYQIEGPAVIKKTAIKVSPGVALYASSTAGRVLPTAASGLQIIGCRTSNAATVASATSTIQALISRPLMQGATS